MARVDRRALFTTGAAAALLAATGVSMAGTPRSGGRLKLAVTPHPDGLAPASRAAVFDGLTEIGPSGVLKGELAVGWEASEDARTWHITLRSDVRFHDETEMTATDVAASLMQHDLPVREVTAEDTHLLRLELRDPNPDLPYQLSDPRLIVCPAGSPERPVCERPGTGLYRMKHAREGRYFLGARVTDHFKDGMAGWADEFEVVMIPDAAVRAEALRDGYVDVAELPQPEPFLGRTDFRYHPSADEMGLAASAEVGLPMVIGRSAPLDDQRIAERWWLA